MRGGDPSSVLQMAAENSFFGVTDFFAQKLIDCLGIRPPVGEEMPASSLARIELLLNFVLAGKPKDYIGELLAKRVTRRRANFGCASSDHFKDQTWKDCIDCVLEPADKSSMKDGWAEEELLTDAAMKTVDFLKAKGYSIPARLAGEIKTLSKQGVCDWPGHEGGRQALQGQYQELPPQDQGCRHPAVLVRKALPGVLPHQGTTPQPCGEVGSRRPNRARCSQVVSAMGLGPPRDPAR